MCTETFTDKQIHVDTRKNRHRERDNEKDTTIIIKTTTTTD